MADAFASFSKFLHQVENLSGLSLCLKRFDPQTATQHPLVAIPPHFGAHYTPFCLKIKKDHNERCIQCDLSKVPHLALSRPSPFVHTCHANATEIIVPLLLKERLVGLIFMGQFRISPDQPSGLALKDDNQIQTLLTLGVLLQRFFLYEIEHGTHKITTTRKVRIHRFLQSRLKQDPTLGELAGYLGVSPSRASHIVKELTGHSYVSLKLILRLEVAREMLKSTMLTVEAVAEAVGFQDVRYFYRAFKKETGLAPAEWRKQNTNHQDIGV